MAIVHLCPSSGSGTMLCCGRTPFETPRGDRMATDQAVVTCRGRMDEIDVLVLVDEAVES